MIEILKYIIHARFELPLNNGLFSFWRDVCLFLCVLFHIEDRIKDIKLKSPFNMKRVDLQVQTQKQYTNYSLHLTPHNYNSIKANS